MSAENSVDRLNQIRRGAIVTGQGVALQGIAPGQQVGEQIRAAKAVDGLLGIADHKEQLLLAGEQTAEDLILQWIGVLKFIHQRGAVLGLNRLCQGRSAIAVERLVGPREQIVKKKKIEPGLLDLQRLARTLKEFDLQIAQVTFQLRLQRRMPLPGGLAQIEKGVAWRGELLFGRAGNLAGRQPLEPLEKRIAPVPLGQRGEKPGHGNLARRGRGAFDITVHFGVERGG